VIIRNKLAESRKFIVKSSEKDFVACKVFLLRLKRPNSWVTGFADKWILVHTSQIRLSGTEHHQSPGSGGSTSSLAGHLGLLMVDSHTLIINATA